MGGRYSDSDDDRRKSRTRKKDSKKRHKRRSYSRSSSSSERSERRRHKSRRSRSSSRSSDHHRRYHKKKSRSPSHKSHHKKSYNDRKKSSDAVFGTKTGTLKDVFDVVPGFSKMTPAEQSKIRVRRALELAKESAKNDLTEEQLLDKIIDKSKDADIQSQITRAQKIADIDNDDDMETDGFIPSHFRSKVNSAKVLSKKQELSQAYNKREGQHELAMFGHSSVQLDVHSSMLSRDEAMKKKEKEDEEALIKAKHHVDFMQRDASELMSNLFKMTEEEREERWLSKLAKLREGVGIKSDSGQSFPKTNLLAT